MRRDKARQGKLACETLPGWIYTRTRAFIAACISELKIIFKFNLQTLNVWLKLKCLVKSLKKQNLSESKQSSDLKGRTKRATSPCVNPTPLFQHVVSGSPLTWKDLMKVHSRVRIPSPRDSSFTSLITRNSRKKVMEILAFSSEFCSPFWWGLVFFFVRKKTQDAWEHMQIDKEMKQTHTHTHIYTRTRINDHEKTCICTQTYK